MFKFSPEYLIKEFYEYENPLRKSYYFLVFLYVKLYCIFSIKILTKFLI